MNITVDTVKDKGAILNYFRNRSQEIEAEAVEKHGENSGKKIASTTGKKLGDSRNALINVLEGVAHRDEWDKSAVLDAALRITYCSYVVMIEVRNSYRPYNFMDFSRRIGELWEPFCKLCFDYPSEEIELFVPPLFSDVRNNLQQEVKDYIEQLQISQEEKAQLNTYYSKVWHLVISGEIKLELDLHFLKGDDKYVVDFKSGFGSNEKGNTNRLLLVATIYRNLDDNYKPILLVRADENNMYYDRLANSGVWKAYSGEAAYGEISNLTGFNMREWTDTNISWEEDLNTDTFVYLADKNLVQYLNW